MKKVFYFFIIFSFSSCSTNYYICTLEKPVEFYPSGSSSSIIISKGKKIIAGKYQTPKRDVIYGSLKGYVLPQTFYTENKIPSGEFKYWKFSDDSTYVWTKDNPSFSGLSGGDVHVKGYYRKNGTYVHPYTRSAS
jgi:hypothetical protein